MKTSILFKRAVRDICALTISALAAVAVTSKADEASPTPPDASSPSLDRRVEKLEGDIGQILQILKAKQGPTPSPSSESTMRSPIAPTGSSPSSTPPIAAGAPSQQPPPASLSPGAILEVWPLKPDFAETIPSGRSSGGFVDKGTYFKLENFSAEKLFESMKSNHVALRWSGFFKIKEPGNYVFTVELQKAEAANPSDWHWATTLLIDQQPIVAESFTIDSSNSRSFSRSAEVTLEPGYYPLALVTVPLGRFENWNYSGKSISVKVRGPSDMLPIPLSSANFLHKE